VQPAEACRDFSRGTCRRTPCRFVHSTPPLAPPYPPSGQRNNQQGRDWCHNFKRGNCTRGSGCRFRHQ
jgi:hypothetical protein